MDKWKDIEEYKGLYQVSDLGNVKSLKFGKERILKPYKNKDGYRRVNLYKNSVQKPSYVHYLVAMAFPEICGEWFDGCVVDHIIPVSMGGTDEATNLRVCTPKQNSNNLLTKQNISEALKGEKHPMFGKHHSDEHKRKLSEALKGKNTGEKNHMWGKFGADNTNSKPVLQYSKDGRRLIKRWACTMDVQRELGIANSSISYCCSGKRKSAGGYVWRYKKEA